MPNQNQPDPNQNTQQNVGGGVPFSPQADLPPLPPEFQNIQNEGVDKNQASPAEAPTNEGSAAPPAPDISNIVPSPKKKFGTGKIIATILSIFLLVGGVGAGIILTQQKQLFQQKAETTQTCESKGQVYCGGCINSCVPYEDFNIEGQTVGCNYLIQKRCGSVVVPGENQTYCDSNGCTGSSANNCVVNRYRCDRNKDLSSGCQDIVTGGPTYDTLNFQESCGAEQIDVACGGTTVDFVSKIYANACTTTTPTPSTPTPTTPTPTTPTPRTPTPPIVAAPYCGAVLAYDSSWKSLSSTQLSALKEGDSINFCVSGNTTSGTFDMARFTINGTQMPDTTTKRPNSVDFCQSYTIPSGKTTFTISAKIHHSTLGWF
ncbi:MAG: hypothetical protein ACD_13C00015G0022 [uncultured bacterium]|uniref:Uncharacterized protein n=1 Tax=Candidatus Woesebacteria bacterium GW2011_GWA1_40_43 TaxID=1618553 RepID=A0A0G0VN02_9BACT|nr:MAG: hypothetical protein ACD_13C00015G0022 [uncultured bacterium]KKR52463.1 MAG: hypothetical protein UT88_C0023G0014 [Candidatus Woesebacteria bacterium GW2011_GWD2_40_19]KKR57027.1 MAG: hypothetical protein UT96_C0028G0007 [Candidatus Woesebacteria bacterium GW2011_GWC2_40_30]KKR64127.1 MAG: hypothetical protein UU02_C0012G0006 [Candidatus Woesebacteria bacterium GW2011_GWA1_40_43]HAU65081.1 hypothetical protein [Candidatus Woesebacteria bacterium]